MGSRSRPETARCVFSRYGSSKPNSSTDKEASCSSRWVPRSRAWSFPFEIVKGAVRGELFRGIVKEKMNKNE